MDKETLKKVLKVSKETKASKFPKNHLFEEEKVVVNQPKTYQLRTFFHKHPKKFTSPDNEIFYKPTFVDDLIEVEATYKAPQIEQSEKRFSQKKNQNIDYPSMFKINKSSDSQKVFGYVINQLPDTEPKKLCCPVIKVNSERKKLNKTTSTKFFSDLKNKDVKIQEEKSKTSFLKQVDYPGYEDLSKSIHDPSTYKNSSVVYNKIVKTNKMMNKNIPKGMLYYNKAFSRHYKGFLDPVSAQKSPKSNRLKPHSSFKQFINQNKSLCLKEKTQETNQEIFSPQKTEQYDKSTDLENAKSSDLEFDKSFQNLDECNNCDKKSVFHALFHENNIPLNAFSDDRDMHILKLFSQSRQCKGVNFELNENALTKLEKLRNKEFQMKNMDVKNRLNTFKTVGFRSYEFDDDPNLESMLYGTKAITSRGRMLTTDLWKNSDIYACCDQSGHLSTRNMLKYFSKDIYRNKTKAAKVQAKLTNKGQELFDKKKVATGIISALLGSKLSEIKTDEKTKLKKPIFKKKVERPEEGVPKCGLSCTGRLFQIHKDALKQNKNDNEKNIDKTLQVIIDATQLKNSTKSYEKERLKKLVI